ncbi:ADP-ribose pyrophosphatase [Lactobacillus sp. CBA3606]|uniref:NUDIX hydrolase n=1 Tax=Lactobacillus sp. CBA3606 TaxID=2099789 RepID=UPI000CFCD644|nr:NUDIX hydrolase [Lactobacillus sp. CBA3606]AVK63249.1 ADP-ribose pyrophosphatase [Lactobacillus sp. CBA3606]
MDFEEQVQTRTQVFDGGLVQVECQVVTLPNQTTATREIVHHQPAVAILMVTAAQQLVLVKQWRAATNGVTFEIPAGKVEPGETPLAAAVRELNEETRLVADQLTPIAEFYTSPGFTDEYMTLYVATGLQPVTTALPQDADEQLRLVYRDLPTVMGQVTRGELADAKTVMAVWYWQSHQALGVDLHG